jgi:nucleoside-diphosphate-sugar epimerase
VKLHRRRRVMRVTGASGFLGRHLVRGPVGVEREVITPPSSAMDITDRVRTLDTITDLKPDVVAHLACRKDRHAMFPTRSSSTASTSVMPNSPSLRH